MENFLVVLVLLLISLHSTEAFGTGAPAAGCVGLQPLHNGVAVQPSASPYNFSISSMYYTPGIPLNVTITGAGFGGFLLQARVSNTNTAVGTFSVVDSARTKNLQCQALGDSITHTNTDSKQNLQLRWMPPSSNVGTVVFMGSVAQSKQAWWGTMSSAHVAFRAGAGEVQVSLLLTTLAMALSLASRLV